MSDYYGLYGQKVQYLASDPTDVQTGQVWYNSTSATLKVRQLATVNAFASGTNLPTAIWQSAGAGTATAGLVFAGGSSPLLNSTFKYDGTTWTSSGNYIAAARGVFSAGTQTAALGSGGYDGNFLTSTAHYNGTSWTSVPATLNTGRLDGASFGLQTAAINAGGDAPGVSNATESYNGSSWTSVNNLNTSRRLVEGTGSQTAGLAFGGLVSPPNTNFVNNSESWNGTSWTATPTLNTSLGARGAIGGPAGQTASVAAGGWTGPSSASSATERWNGSSWTTNPSSLATARGYGTGVGTSDAGFLAGGNPGDYTNGLVNTEEWTGTELQNKTVTVS